MSRTTVLVTGVSIIGIAVLLATTVLAPAGTGDDLTGLVPSILGAPEGVAIAAGLETVAGCDEFAETMQALAVESGIGPFGAGNRDMRSGVEDEAMTEEAAGDDSASFDADGGAATLGATGTDTDGTNVQVAGVDEPDVVERVGDLTLVGTQGMLRVVTVGADGTPVARGELRIGTWGELEMMAVGTDRAVAIIRDGLVEPVRASDDDSSMIRPAWSSTAVALLDLADPDAPRELSRLDMEGWLVDARAVDGIVRVAVAGEGPQVDLHAMGEFESELAMDWENATEADYEQFETAYQAEYEQRMAIAIEQVEPTDWQPHVRVTSATGSRVEPLVACDRIGFPSSFAGVGTLTVAAIDATGDELAIDDAASVVTAGQQLYSTADRLVIATTRWEPCCDEPTDPPAEEPVEEPFFDDDEDAADAARGSDATAVATTSAMVDIGIMPGPWGRGSATDLHVFDVDGTVVSHVTSGSVDGWLLNQFSMSIHDGVLRVATTEFDEDAGRTESAVTTFRVEGTELVRLGGVDGLGPDEDIQAVRFMGDVAYVVTFRRTDPLYVVDLADPTAPETLGELKIEGYSAYLHPLGPDRLLGVGQDADPDSGITEGVQVSTFDVTDPAAPTRIDVDVTPDSWSDVEWDHHALTITRDGTVLVPFEQWAENGEGQGRLGVLVYEVTDAGALVRVGVLDHGNRWELRPRRTVDLGDVLLTVGEQGVTTWDAQTFQPLGSVTFPEPDWDELERGFEEEG